MDADDDVTAGNVDLLWIEYTKVSCTNAVISDLNPYQCVKMKTQRK
jgi:hypothetical protein